MRLERGAGWQFGRWQVTWLFEPRDLWIGLYWAAHTGNACDNALHLYVCLLPMLPLRLIYHYPPAG